MNRNTNWGSQADYSHSNWTLRTPRQMKSYLRYTKDDQRIPLEGWVLGALVLFAVFGFLPLLYWITK
jgi:hypothetical protein